MSTDHKKLKTDAALAEWLAIPSKHRRSLIQELGNMALEAAEKEKEFSAACNGAANLLHAISGAESK